MSTLDVGRDRSSAASPFALVDQVLRGMRVGDLSPREAGVFIACSTTLASAYGFVMGTYGGRFAQSLYGGLKAPMLLLVTAAASLPTFFVLHTLYGLRDDFGRACRALLMFQLTLTTTLVALAPITVVWYASVRNYPAAVLFNALVFGVSALAGQRVLRRAYAELIARRPEHRLMLRVWFVLYAFVGIQMGWLLRPFIGRPERPVQLFRHGAWGNAYVEVLDLVRLLLFGT